MAANAVISVKIDKRIKDKASIILATIGLTPSDALRIMMTRVASEKSMPFDLLVPNEETIAAIKEARIGKLKSSTSVEDLMADLKTND
jgi:DNA-damage-inducible protein J